ncbi:MAG: Dabb family protein [Saprospiraceae bacterium]|nr:Dabb family protein [Saprospiraceae bacterium]
MSQQQAPGYIHMVYFWVKEGTTQDQLAAFQAGVAKLGEIHHVQSIWVGPPAGTPREVVDNSYDYALLAFFENKVAHDAYQIDPDHHRFVEQFSQLWERVQVYDHLPE